MKCVGLCVGFCGTVCVWNGCGADKGGPDPCGVGGECWSCRAMVRMSVMSDALKTISNAERCVCVMCV